jgi:hypothetical protein
MRTARCQCSQLTITVAGEPSAVLACSCLACQRRTGSVLHVSASYPADAVIAIAGNETLFARPSESEGTITFHLCPTCGTTVYWYEGPQAEAVGIAVGCFADPNFPPPTVAYHALQAHPWIGLPAGVELRDGG